MKTRPTQEEIEKKMVELAKKNGPYEIEGLWMAARLAFGQKLSHLYTDKLIREIDLRRAIANLLDRRELYFLPNRKLSSRPYQGR